MRAPDGRKRRRGAKIGPFHRMIHLHSPFIVTLCKRLLRPAAWLVACLCLTACSHGGKQPAPTPKDERHDGKAATTRRAADSLLSQVYSLNHTHFDSCLQLIDRLEKEATLPRHEANETRGNVYYNRGNFFEALKYYKRALYDKETEDNDEARMRITRRVLMCYDNTQNLTEMSYYTKLLRRLAEGSNDSVMLATALFNEGKIAYSAGRRSEAADTIHQAIHRMRQAAQGKADDEIYYYYITLIEYLQEAGSHHDALATADELTQFCRQARSDNDTPFWNDARRRVDVAVHRCRSLHRLGRTAEADSCYRLFCKAPDVYFYDFSRVLPYLAEAGRHTDIVSLIAHPRFSRAAETSDPTPDLILAYKTLGDAYYHLGSYNEAASTYRHLDSINNLRRTADEQSAINELTNNYEQRQTIVEAERRMAQQRWQWTVAVAAVLLAGGIVLLLRERHNKSIILRKNQWMARHIEQLHARHEAEGTPADDSAAACPDTAAPSATDTSADADGATTDADGATADTDGATAPPAAPNHDAGHEAADGGNAIHMHDVTDRRLFESLRHRLIDERLFLDPNLKRDTLLEELHIPKNKFSQLFKRFAGKSYTQYVGDLRLEYACKVIQRHPQYTNEAVAAECGIASPSTLYTLFSQKYGMTPSEYRKAILCMETQPPTPEEA